MFNCTFSNHSTKTHQGFTIFFHWNLNSKTNTLRTPPRRGSHLRQCLSIVHYQRSSGRATHHPSPGTSVQICLSKKKVQSSSSSSSSGCCRRLLLTCFKLVIPCRYDSSSTCFVRYDPHRISLCAAFGRIRSSSDPRLVRDALRWRSRLREEALNRLRF